MLAEFWGPEEKKLILKSISNVSISRTLNGKDTRYFPRRDLNDKEVLNALGGGGLSSMAQALKRTIFPGLGNLTKCLQPAVQQRKNDAKHSTRSSAKKTFYAAAALTSPLAPWQKKRSTVTSSLLTAGKEYSFYNAIAMDSRGLIWVIFHFFKRKDPILDVTLLFRQLCELFQKMRG